MAMQHSPDIDVVGAVDVEHPGALPAGIDTEKLMKPVDSAAAGSLSPISVAFTFPATNPLATNWPQSVDV